MVYEATSSCVHVIENVLASGLHELAGRLGAFL